MEDKYAYDVLIIRRDSSARLCADALLRGDTEYAFTKAIEFKDADNALAPYYAASKTKDVVPSE
jgi:hypothetical protein